MKDKILHHHTKVVEMAESGYKYADVARELNVNKSSVRRYAEKHDIAFTGKRFNQKTNPDVGVSVLSLYKNGMTGRQIAEKLNLNYKTVYVILKQNDSINPERFNYKRGVIDDNAFLDFENDKLAAYFYGWLVTDGCLSDTGNISLYLQASDGYIVERLLEYVGIPKNLVVKETKRGDKSFYSTGASFSDKAILKRLVEQGLAPRKSGKESLPKFNWLNGKTAKDFWQGCIEGDGCVFVKGINQISLIGSDELLIGFIKFCENVCGVKKGKVLNKIHNTDKIKQVTYNNNDAMLIAKVLWDNTAFRLERKYQIATELIAAETERQKRYAMKYISKDGDAFVVSVLVKRNPFDIKVKPLYLKRCNTLQEAQELRDEFMELYQEMINS